ncbi:MAG: phage major capsid protein [Bacteroidales bacterium]|nr:phage major capsid protein [Bacteroidales bacterium]
MTKREELTAKQDALIALKERIEADDTEAIEEGVQLKADIETLTAEVEAADKKAGLLETIGTKEEPNQEDNIMNTEGLKALNLEALKGQRGSTSVELKASTDPAPVAAPPIPVVSQNVGEINYKLGVREAFGREAISGNTLTYFVMQGVSGTPGAITLGGQGSAKAQIEPLYEPVTEALKKIACYIKETDELLSDAPFLESVVRGRGVYEQQKAVEAELVSQLTNTVGINTTYQNAGLNFDNLLKAKCAVEAATGYDADTILINPVDLQTLLLTKDETHQYLMGGPAYAPYGNGAYGAYLPIWGCKVIATNAITQGKAVIGAFKQGAAVVTKVNEGLRVEVSNSDQDDFIKNLITVRIEERILLAVRVPSAFAIVSAE